MLDLELYQQYIDKAKGIIARQLLAGEKPIKLTNDEKFAIALISGVKIKSSGIRENKVYFETIPCGIAWDGRRFIVCTNE